MKEPRRAVEEAVIDFLEDVVPTVDFFPNDGDNTRDLPFCVVMCKNVEPLIGGIFSNAYKGALKVVYVSHINDYAQASNAHAEAVKSIEHGLEAMSSPFASGTIYINGLAIELMETASEDQSFANVITCVIGFQETGDLDGDPTSC